MNELHVRVNQFDQWIGRIQTEQSIKQGVGSSLLDVGCGIGMYTPMFLKKFRRVVGIDPSEEYLKEARKRNGKVEYVVGYGETFTTDEHFDTINMTMLLEHVDNPVEVLKNCKTLLAPGGRILIHVPNASSTTRQLGVIMGIIPSVMDISKKERNYYGHQRVYTQKLLEEDCRKAGLIPVITGFFFKPLTNRILLDLCLSHGASWTKKFLRALFLYGETIPVKDRANLFAICT